MGGSSSARWRWTRRAEHAVLRVVQEALANAVKHARPNRIRLRLSRQDGQVAVTVSDDGAGFDPTAWNATAAARGESVLEHPGQAGAGRPHPGRDLRPPAAPRPLDQALDLDESR